MQMKVFCVIQNLAVMCTAVCSEHRLFVMCQVQQMAVAKAQIIATRQVIAEWLILSFCCGPKHMQLKVKIAAVGEVGGNGPAKW